jgi:hypothetical protein
MKQCAEQIPRRFKMRLAEAAWRLGARYDATGNQDEVARWSKRREASAQRSID